MHCPVCQHETLVVASKVIRSKKLDVRTLLCPECKNLFEAHTTLISVQVRNPERRGKTYSLPLVKLDDDMIEYLIGRRLHPRIMPTLE